MLVPHRTGGGASRWRILIVIALLCAELLAPASALAVEPMLPQVYSEQVDVSGWLMSEKLDGVRGFWDGERLWSKNGRLLQPPREFVRDLPPFALEGEIWGGRGSFERTVSIVNTQSPHPGWRQLRFAIFDVPQAPGIFVERLERAKQWFAAHPSANAFVIPQFPVHDRQHLRRWLREIEAGGGEGLIVRRPDALYVAGRSATILKVKSHQDAEATVVAHLPGRGRNDGRLGSLLVEEEGGRRFRIGSGFSDAERDAPPAVGSVITFKFYGRYPSGIPKFPSFLRIREDRGL